MISNQTIYIISILVCHISHLFFTFHKKWKTFWSHTDLGILGHRTSKVTRPKRRFQYFIPIHLRSDLHGNLTSTPKLPDIRKSCFSKR